MRKHAEDLARDHELGKDSFDFYEYIIDSLINGQRQQVRDLFNSLKKYDQRDFLVNFIDPSIGYHKTALNICIEELTE